MADYDEELSEIESEVDRLTRQVSGYERVGQSTPKYIGREAAGEYATKRFFFRFKKADHCYWKLINYALTWARPNLFLSIFMPVARMLQHGC